MHGWGMFAVRSTSPLSAKASPWALDLLAWLTDVLERVVSGRTKAHELERLLPWAWKAEQLVAAARA